VTSPAGRVLIVDDEEGIREIFSRLVRREGFEPLVAPDGETALAIIRRQSPDVVLLDIWMPGLDGMEVLRRAKALDATLPIVIVTSHGFVKAAVEALRAGAHDYLEKPVEHADLIRSLHRAMTERKLQRTIQILTDRVRESDSLRDMMGPSDVIARISADVAQVARSNFAVLIAGETGTGKELVARAIHQASPRVLGPFVAVDCGAVPETLFESEIFGHEKGAFTGAERQKPGKFEVASGGTLFLDEITNMPLGSQAKLLRVLQEKHVTRVGGTNPVTVDIRLVSATNRGVGAAVAAGTFRQDLFFRINEFVITIPPLRERRSDIIFLAKRFLDLTNHELGKTVGGFSEAAVERLLGHDWPGNVRELRSTIRRVVLLADETIEAEHLALQRAAASLGSYPVQTGQNGDGLLALRALVRHATATVERAALREALQRSGGNKAKAARLLQIDYKTIQTKIKEYGIASRGGDRDGQQAEGQRPAP
jgi:two-component system nitrogen regulation response regulator GlnG